MAQSTQFWQSPVLSQYVEVVVVVVVQVLVVVQVVVVPPPVAPVPELVVV